MVFAQQEEMKKQEERDREMARELAEKEFERAA